MAESAPSALLGLDDHTFAVAWPRLTLEERRAMPRDVQRECIARFLRLTHYVGSGIARAERTECRAQRVNGTEHAHQAASDGVELICAANVASEPVGWLWPDWIAAGKLHLIGGAPSTGKTTLALALAATLTSGGGWPDDTRCTELGSVLIWSGEDGMADTLVPRLEAMGADLTRVHFVGRVADERGSRPFDPAGDMPELAAAAAAIADLRMLIVDPVVSAVAGDSHKNAEVRRGLQPVVDFAEARGVAAIGVTHFSKGTQGRDPLERLTGSLAFGALARLAFAAAKMKDQRLAIKGGCPVQGDALVSTRRAVRCLVAVTRRQRKLRSCVGHVTKQVLAFGLLTLLHPPNEVLQPSFDLWQREAVIAAVT
jgi:hypothetical protein